MKILFTGGGTGGHLMPIIAVVREIRKLYSKNDLKLYYIGPYDKLGIPLLSKENLIIHTIISGKIRRYFSRSGFSASQINLATLLQNITDIFFKIPLGFVQSFLLILFINPKLVFSKGGSGSAIVCASAKILNIPIFLHESDSVPGLSNRIVSKWARKIFTSFPKTEYFDELGAIAVGNPIREELLKGDVAKAKEIFNLTSQKPVILFLGGSQGAEAINEFVLSVLSDILADYEVIHVSGARNYIKTQSESQVVLNLSKDLKIYYHLYESLNEVQLKNAYSASGLIVSRAGSGSVFEIAAVGKPSILIPLPSAASDHQSKNAYQYSKTGAAFVIEQENLTHNFFLSKINYLLSRSKKMTEAALKFAKPQASKAITKEILEYLHVY